MAHILINPSLSAARASKNVFNPTIFAEVIAILEPARSMRMDISTHGHKLSGHVPTHKLMSGLNALGLQSKLLITTT